MMYTDDPNHIFHRKIPECVCTQQPVKEGIEGENPSPCSRDTFFLYGENILLESERNSNT